MRGLPGWTDRSREPPVGAWVRVRSGRPMAVRLAASFVALGLLVLDGGAQQDSVARGGDRSWVADAVYRMTTDELRAALSERVSRRRKPAVSCASGLNDRLPDLGGAGRRGQ